MGSSSDSDIGLDSSGFSDSSSVELPLSESELSESELSESEPLEDVVELEVPVPVVVVIPLS